MGMSRGTMKTSYYLVAAAGLAAAAVTAYDRMPARAETPAATIPLPHEPVGLVAATVPAMPAVPDFPLPPIVPPPDGELAIAVAGMPALSPAPLPALPTTPATTALPPTPALPVIPVPATTKPSAPSSSATRNAGFADCPTGCCSDNTAHRANGAAAGRSRSSAGCVQPNHRPAAHAGEARCA